MTLCETGESFADAFDSDSGFPIRWEENEEFSVESANLYGAGDPADHKESGKFRCMPEGLVYAGVSVSMFRPESTLQKKDSRMQHVCSSLRHTSDSVLFLQAFSGEEVGRSAKIVEVRFGRLQRHAVSCPTSRSVRRKRFCAQAQDIGTKCKAQTLHAIPVS